MFWYIVMRDKVTKKVKGQFSAPDHPAMLMGKTPEDYPHPWVEHYDESKHEIVYINPDDKTLDDIHALRADGRSVLEVIEQEFDIDDLVKPPWPKQEIVLGLDPDWKQKQPGDLVGVKMGTVPRPKNAKTATLKKK